MPLSQAQKNNLKVVIDDDRNEHQQGWIYLVDELNNTVKLVGLRDVRWLMGSTIEFITM